MRWGPGGGVARASGEDGAAANEGSIQLLSRPASGEGEVLVNDASRWIEAREEEVGAAGVIQECGL